MSQEELFEVAQFLIELLEIELEQETVDPTEPSILIEALGRLFPRQRAIWQEIKGESMEEQWNAVIQFVEVRLLEGQELPIEVLGMQEILDIYEIVAEYAEQAVSTEKKEFEKRELKEQFKAEKPIKEDKKGKSQKPQKQKQAPKQKQSKPKDAKQKKNQSSKEVSQEKKGDSAKAATKNKDKQKPKQPQIPSNIQEKSKQNIKDKKNQKSKEKSQEKSKNKDRQEQKPKEKSKSTNQLLKSTKVAKIVQPQSISISTNQIISYNKPKPNHKKSQCKQPSAQPLQNELLRNIKTAINRPSSHSIKTNTLLRDTKNNEAVAQAGRKFDYFLKDYQRQSRKIQLSTALRERQQRKKGGLVDQYYLKVMRKKQQQAQQRVAGQQLKYFMALRDRKMAFLNKINKLTTQLERQRQIEWQKQQKNQMQQQRAKVAAKIQAANAVFSTNLQLLRQTYVKTREKNQMQDYNQRQICSQMEKQVRKKKLAQIGQMQLLWQQEQMKLNAIMGDEQKVKDRLIDVYRKHCP